MAFSSLSLFLYYFQMIRTFWFLNGVLSIGFLNWVKTNVRRISLKSGYGRHNLASFLPIVWSLHPKNSCREKILQNKTPQNLYLYLQTRQGVFREVFCSICCRCYYPLRLLSWNWVIFIWWLTSKLFRRVIHSHLSPVRRARRKVRGI